MINDITQYTGKIPTGATCQFDVVSAWIGSQHRRTTSIPQCENLVWSESRCCSVCSLYDTSLSWCSELHRTIKCDKCVDNLHNMETIK